MVCLGCSHTFGHTQVPLFCRQPFPGLQDDRAEHFTMKRGSLSLVRSQAVPLLAFIEKSPDLVDRDIARRIYETALCPPLPPLSFLKLAPLELLCAGVSFARACGIAYRRKRKNKIRRVEGPAPSADPDLPGEIYTLW